jgi:hypothetical protein
VRDAFVFAAEARVCAKLTPPPTQDQQNYLFLQKFLQFEQMKLDSFHRFELPTSHLFGPHIMFPQLSTFHPTAYATLHAAAVVTTKPPMRQPSTHATNAMRAHEQLEGRL